MAEVETSGKNGRRIRIDVPDSLILEIDRRVEAANRKDPERRASRNGFFRTAAREYLRRHPA